MRVGTDIQFLMSSILEVYGRNTQLMVNSEFGIDNESNSFKLKVPMDYVNSTGEIVKGMYMTLHYETKVNEYTIEIYKNYNGQKAMLSTRKYSTLGKSVGELKSELYSAMKMYGGIQGFRLKEEIVPLGVQGKFKFVQYLVYILEQEYGNNFTIKIYRGYINIYINRTLLIGRLYYGDSSNADINENEILTRLVGEYLYVDFLGLGISTVEYREEIKTVSGLTKFLQKINQSVAEQYQRNTFGGVMLETLHNRTKVKDYKYKTDKNMKFMVILANEYGFDRLYRVRAETDKEVREGYTVTLIGKYITVDGMCDKPIDIFKPTGYPTDIKYNRVDIEEIRVEQLIEEMEIRGIELLSKELEDIRNYIRNTLTDRLKRA